MARIEASKTAKINLRIAVPPRLEIYTSRGDAVCVLKMQLHSQEWLRSALSDENRIARAQIRELDGLPVLIRPVPSEEWLNRDWGSDTGRQSGDKHSQRADDARGTAAAVFKVRFLK